MAEYIVTSDTVIPGAKKLIRCKNCKHRPIILSMTDHQPNLQYPDYVCICRALEGYYPRDEFYCGCGELD